MFVDDLLKEFIKIMETFFSCPICSGESVKNPTYLREEIRRAHITQSGHGFPSYQRLSLK
ncbi:hypothetical protein MKW92_021590 [Papaver armeniacum]|nr:hypothetical protein MKW92_021590 [Papaver armeniacum]